MTGGTVAGGSVEHATFVIERTYDVPPPGSSLHSPTRPPGPVG